MARSRRALLRKGNVTNIAEARKKREEKQQAKEQALANARIGTLEEASKHADAVQAALALEANAAQMAGHQTAASAQGGHNTGIPVQSASAQTSSASSGGVSASAPPTEASSSPAGAGQSSDGPPAPAALRESEPSDDESATALAEAAARRERAAKKNANRTFNREKVEAIKKAIANGTYEINATRVADKFIERESPA